ncbi:SWI/SNF complex component SNF12-like protein [Frankliniella fusca]|uniref:SWI/SNF complex component SNF12-like protein n=1 Tax=Frankliniella fusca TaxID=407009 RepID=A0AAE1HFD0_9NEOP|nr:SWI/SNF complex component SNF12-like protein [Frankliniella fusca]
MNLTRHKGLFDGKAIDLLCVVAVVLLAAGALGAGGGGPTAAPLRTSTDETMSSVDWTAATAPPPTPAANMTSLDFLLDVFSADRLARVWDQQAGVITEHCYRDLAVFFEARKHAHIWALKMCKLLSLILPGTILIILNHTSSINGP